MTRKRVLECREQCDPLLTECGEITANATEHRHPLFGAKAARDLLLHFDHPQISLRLVIVKWHSKIEQEAQHGPLPLRESIQQIASRALFGPPWSSLRLFRLLRGWRRGVGLVAFCEKLIIATQQAREQQDIQFMLTQRFGLLDL